MLARLAKMLLPRRAGGPQKRRGVRNELVPRGTQEIRRVRGQIQAQGVLVLRALQLYRELGAHRDREPHGRLRFLRRRELEPAEPGLRSSDHRPKRGAERQEAPPHRPLGLVATGRFRAADRIVALIGYALLDGTPGDNRYGSNPKEATARTP